MSKLVKFTQLNEIFTDLWTKVKRREIKNASFDKETKNVTLEKDEQNVVFNLDGVVTKWNDLSHASERDITTLNLFNYDSKITGQWWGNSGAPSYPTANSDYSMVYVDIEKGKQYTILKQVNDGIHRVFFLNDNNERIAESTYSPTSVNGWFKCTIPSSHTSGENRKKITIQFKHGEITNNQIMVFEGDFNPVQDQQFVPYTGKPVLIDSNSVSLSYSSDNGSIKSKTVHEAIEELSTKSVKTWSDLKYANEYPYANLLDITKSIRGSWYNEQGSIISSGPWSRINVPIESGRTYTLLKNFDDWSGRIVYFTESDSVVSVDNANLPLSNGWYRRTFTVPSDGTIKKVGISFQHRINESASKPVHVMLIEGTINERIEFIPYLYGKTVSIGTGVSLGFDRENTNLTSDTIDGAIKEIASKGVTLGADGKIPTSMLPDVSINDFHSVQTQSEAMELARNGSLQSGDVVIVRNENNALHMWMGTTTGDFHNNFVELNVSNGTVKKVNNRGADAQGNVTINAEHIAANVNGQQSNVQNGLNTLKTKSDNIDNRVSALEANPHPHHVGELITTFKNLHAGQDLTGNNDFKIGNTTFIWLGKFNKQVSYSLYPELAQALGKSGTGLYYIPHIADVTLSNNITQCHYIVAKVDV